MMFKRFILINCPGLGVGNIRNTSSSEHSLEKLLKYAYTKDLKPNLAGLETIGLGAFVKFASPIARKVSTTAMLAAKTIHGEDDFSAYIEIGGGDKDNMGIWGQLENLSLISICNDDTLLPTSEFVDVQSDGEAVSTILEYLSAPLTRNELIVATLNDYRQSALEKNPTFATACLSQFSCLIEKCIIELGNEDALMAFSSTAIDASIENNENNTENNFRNELLPMFFYTPSGQTNDLGLRLLCDIGPSIADFFDIDRSNFAGATMGKWLFKKSNPQIEQETSLHS